MPTPFKQFFAVLCLSGCIAIPSWVVAAGSSSAKADNIAALRLELASLKKEMHSLQYQLKTRDDYGKHRDTHHVVHHRHRHSHLATATAVNQSRPVSQQDGKKSLNSGAEQQEYLPFDPDVPGQAFVSTGPYVGVPLQYAGTNLIINSPSVNTDVQLLGIRKSILQHLSALGNIVAEPTHSHLLLSGIVEAQAGYFSRGGSPSTTDIDITNVSLDAFFLGPSEWTLGFVEFTYDNSPPIGNNGQYLSNSVYRVANSRVAVNKAFITIGNLKESPFYGTIGQFYVPFGTYSTVMVSDPLTKLLARTKARAVVLGYQSQDKNPFYGSLYAFRGDSHVASVSKVNNGGINLGYKYSCNDIFKLNVGGGVIANIADSTGMQFSTFSSAEQIAHRVPAYNLRGLFSIGQHVDVIAEYVAASTRFNPNDMAFNGHGAKPWALDAEAVYSFTIFDNKPSSIGIGYSKSDQALALGLPLTRTSLVFNTSLWRNTLQSLEFRRDREYAASNAAVGAGVAVKPETGKVDNAITAQFDYYF